MSHATSFTKHAEVDEWAERVHAGPSAPNDAGKALFQTPALTLQTPLREPTKRGTLAALGLGGCKSSSLMGDSTARLKLAANDAEDMPWCAKSFLPLRVWWASV